MHNMPIEEVSRLILSPFLPGFDGERTARALLDIKLRERGEQYIALSSVSYLAKKKNAPFYSPALGSLLDAWQVQYADMKGQQRPGLWAESFSRLLQSGRQTMDDTGTLASTGWPGYWPPGSIEYQTCAVWEELLSGLVELDGVCKKISRQRAVSILRRMASSKIFNRSPSLRPCRSWGFLRRQGCRLIISGCWECTMMPGRLPANPLLLCRSAYNGKKDYGGPLQRACWNMPECLLTSY